MRLFPIACSAAATILVAGAALLPAASAQAATLGTLTCQGTDFTTFAPALTSTPTPTLIFGDDTYGPCVSTDTTISGGFDYTQTSNPNASCATLLSGGNGSTTITWNNGNFSTFSYTASTIDVNGEIITTETGTITSGEFAGNLATEVVILPTLDLTACRSGTGLATASGTVTLEILPL
jgi:hypothetical protein